MEFLVEVELGEAPPLKYIVRNLTADHPIPELVNPDPGEERVEQPRRLAGRFPNTATQVPFLM